MAEINHVWGQDFAWSPSGDFGIVDGLAESTQAIIRRLMTAWSELLLHKDYGGSVPERIGRVLDEVAIQSVMRSQIFKEATVAKTPEPVITTTSFLGGVTVSIVYTWLVTGTQQTLSFDLNN